MAQQETNLEQTDFSAGFVSDINPLTFPPNATVEEQNFEIRSDNSRHRRRGLAFDADAQGTIITPDPDFFKYDESESVVYSTISPNGSDAAPFNARKTDVVTITDVFENDRIFSFNAADDTLSKIPHNTPSGGSNSANGDGPYFVTKHTTRQAYVSTGTSQEYQVSLIYGWDQSANELGVTEASSIVYDGGEIITTSVSRVADIVSWSGRMVYGFNTSDDSSGQAIGISALPDPTTSAVAQVAILAQCQQQGESLTGDDGAWLEAGDLGAIQRIVPYRTGLLIFTTDNIWYLYSSAGYFNPYEFNFDKISDTRVIGNKSIVIRDNILLFWAESGIYVISPDENTGLPKLKNITEKRIQKWYEGLSPNSKREARGIFNKENTEVRWLYQANPLASAPIGTRRFDSELVMSLATGAYTLNRFPYEAGKVTYILEYIPDNAVEEDFSNARVFSTNPAVEGNPIETVTVGGEEVIVEFLANFRYTSSYKYIIRDGAQVARVAALEDESFKDYVGSVEYPTGQDAYAYMKSGYFTMQSTSRRKSPNYITTTYKATESGYVEVDDEVLTPSSCLMTAYWDFANDDYAGKIHGPYQTYRLNRVYMPDETVPATSNWTYGQDYISTKNKIRGRGRTLQFKFETEPDKDCQLYAWSYNGEVLTRV